MELISRTAPSAATTFVTPAGWRYAASRPAAFVGRAQHGLRGVGRPVTAVGADMSAMRGAGAPATRGAGALATRGARALATRSKSPNTSHKSIQHTTCVVESTALGAELEPPPLRAPR